MTNRNCGKKASRKMLANFTNPLAQSEKNASGPTLLVHWTWNYAVRPVPYASKFRLNLPVRKLHIKWWWNWLQPGVNFTNILHAAFMLADPKSAIKDSQLKQLFTYLGSASVKALGKHVDEIDPKATFFSEKWRVQT